MCAKKTSPATRPWELLRAHRQKTDLELKSLRAWVFELHLTVLGLGQRGFGIKGLGQARYLMNSESALNG